MALKRFFIVAAVFLWPSFAAARDITPAEARSLDETVRAYVAATEVNDMTVAVDTIPPAMRTFLARQMGIDEAALRENLIREIRQAMQSITLESFDLDLASAEHRALDDGTPFVLIPTETVFDTGQYGRMVARSHTLALLDDGKWYLLRVSEAKQLLILRQVYPGFAGVEFPRGSMEAVKE